MSEQIDVTGWIERYRQAWLSKDTAGVQQLFAQDALYRSNPLRAPHVGRAAIGEYWHEATRTQQELDLRFGAAVVQGDRATVEWWATMRDDDWYQSEDPAHGVTLPGCLILRFDADGRCVELREYFNPGFGGRQAAPPGWGQ